MSGNGPNSEKDGFPVNESASVNTTKSTIYSVPEGYILEIDEIVVQQDSTAGLLTLTDEGTYLDGSTVFTRTVHAQNLTADEFDDTRQVDVRVNADLKGVTSAGTTTVIIKGRLI